MKLCTTEPDFLGKFFLPRKLGKWTKNGPKMVFWIYWKIYSIYSIIKTYIICSVLHSPLQNSAIIQSCKIFVPEIWAKMFPANQIAGFFNQPYLQNKSVKWSDFLHFDTNSHKPKFNKKCFEWAWSEMDVTSLVMELRIDSILRLNWWNEPIFCMLVQIQECWKLF